MTRVVLLAAFFYIFLTADDADFADLTLIFFDFMTYW
jgi:hypothetical protein